MEPGTIVGGRFEIVSFVGAGGMGAVYRATDRQSGATVALKTIDPGADIENALRFEREAKLLGELRHPGIVAYVAHGVDEGRMYLVMEWLEGEDLAARLQRSGVSLVDAVMIGVRVAEALAAAHARGVIHRDVKPSNIFLEGGSASRVRLVDFGIATLAARADAITETGTAIGTPGYLAPEQARGSRDLDGRVDLFSLGCVLFECLTGRPPFIGDQPVAVLAKVLVEDPPCITDLAPAVPPALEALVEQLLQKVPGARPRDAATVAAMLDELRPSLGDDVAGPKSMRRPPRYPGASTGC